MKTQWIRIKFEKKKNIKNQMQMDKIEKQINQIRYNQKIKDDFAMLQG
jgi:hypothetical protein